MEPNIDVPEASRQRLSQLQQAAQQAQQQLQTYFVATCDALSLDPSQHTLKDGTIVPTSAPENEADES